jgi:hypothetical protein
VRLQHHQYAQPMQAPARLQQGLALLVEAARYAEQTHCDPWEFAVEIDQLRAIGLSKNDLRFLIRLRLMNHAIEVPIFNHAGRKFRRTGDLCFSERTCFVLTAKGFAALNQQYPAIVPPRTDASSPLRIAEDDATELPAWDAARHVLSFAGHIVKRYKWRATNQELILSAFQEEGWPVRIDDPLKPSPVVHAKRRLSDTIKCLNRNQLLKLIQFRGDGRGQGVTWESTTPAD